MNSVNPMNGPTRMTIVALACAMVLSACGAEDEMVNPIELEPEVNGDQAAIAVDRERFNHPYPVEAATMAAHQTFDSTAVTAHEDDQ